MILKQGISTPSPGSLKGNSLESISSRLSKLETLLHIPVRVTDIVLNDSHPRFNEVGQYNGIGAIFFEGFENEHCTYIRFQAAEVVLVSLPFQCYLLVVLHYW